MMPNLLIHLFINFIPTILHSRSSENSQIKCGKGGKACWGAWVVTKSCDKTTIIVKPEPIKRLGGHPYASQSTAPTQVNGGQHATVITGNLVVFDV